MAQLAFAAAGTAIGAMFGMPQLGFLAGSLVGTLLFPQKGPDVTSEGPRLGDLSVSSSAYGAPIAIGYGTLRMGGNIIWSSGIREQKTVKKVSGGKGMGGGGSQKSVTYSYFASFAIAFGEGPAEDVLRIWADGKLIYDKTGSSPLPPAQGGREPAPRSADRKPGGGGPRTGASGPVLPGVRGSGARRLRQPHPQHHRRDNV
jgi:hypothetical protein